MEKDLKRSQIAALKAYPPTFSKGGRYPKRVQSERVDTHQPIRTIYIKAYEQAEKDTISLIESRISEIMGDAQPRPALRAELQELADKIKEGNKVRIIVKED